MSGSQAVFLAVGAIGFLVLLLSFVIGEVEHEVEVSHEIEADHDFDGGGYMPSVFSLKVVTAAMVGFGACGYVSSSYGAPDYVSWPFALVGTVAFGAGILQWVLKPLSKQQSNSMLSRDSYRGLTAKVTLTIESGKSGVVSFHDHNGAYVSRSAVLAEDGVAPVGSEVFIVDVNQSGVTVMPSTLPGEENK